MATNEYLLSLITDTKTIITNVTAAINALLTGGHDNYTLDTGMTVQKVTRLDLDYLRKLRKESISELLDLEAQAGVSTDNTITMYPDF